jgi:PilZ domain
MQRKTPFPPVLSRSAGAERRTQVRHTCSWEAPYRTNDHFGTARVCDVSVGGLGILLPREVSPGGLLTVELRDRQRNSWRLKTLRVVHAAPQSEGLWLVGSAFTKALTTAELAAIMPAAS